MGKETQKDSWPAQQTSLNYPKKKSSQDFPGGPVVKTVTPRFHCRGHGFKSLVGELRSHLPCSVTKKLKKEKKKSSWS